MTKYVIISNWSQKDQEALIAQSEASGVGNATPRLSLTGDMALLKLDEEYLAEDMVGYTHEEILEELDAIVWTDTPSDGGEIEI